MAEPAAIRVRALGKRFGTRVALDDVGFTLPEGAFLSIFGPNGAGKTTLLRVLSTLARPSTGSVELLGVDAHEQPEDARALVGLVSHASMLYPDLTAEENLVFYARLYGLARPQERARELLDAVGLTRRRLDVVRTFSRGMTQRLAIARALVHDPRIVLLDEPYSGLDPHAMRILDELIAANRDGRTFAMVSHDLDKGLALATHALVLACGRVVAYEPLAELDEAAFRALYAETVGMGVS